MSELTDEQREQGARNRAAQYEHEQLGEAAKDRAALLRLLDIERARVSRMLDLGRFWNGPGHAPGRWDSSHAIELRQAAEGTLDWSMWEAMANQWAAERGLDASEAKR